MEKVNKAFETFNKSWTNLNKFEDSDLGTLLIRKNEIEDWFKWHPNHPDEPAIKEQYNYVLSKIETFNKPKNERCEVTP